MIFSTISKYLYFIGNSCGGSLNFMLILPFQNFFLKKQTVGQKMGSEHCVSYIYANRPFGSKVCLQSLKFLLKPFQFDSDFCILSGKVSQCYHDK